MANYNEGPNKPFNDAIAHQQKIEGQISSGGGRLPLPIRLIKYFVIGSVVLLVLLTIIGGVFLN
ncbi:hypothetical protein [Halobacillus sp. H74]|uniref:hypothetical protein n=1 Tax=Halobacillus sp. H74 TaxID=3457436 RepID=UPI003FCE7AD4